jgi:hypothetical protein
MYTHLLDAAFEELPPPAVGTTTTEALSALLHWRDRLESREIGVDRTTTTLADQLAYDISLIRLARSAGIVCDTTMFDQPERTRSGIEQELISRGVPLDAAANPP